ncbi:SDR family oxidoreductase [Lacibacter luteus]|uniref:SDR family oxidoreductase n=1 Tax=Lacibacter luteus TaxID=2508719 RepID=A0A4Q1CML1_9BACT|nr:SDR family oxidoreductase [Lacibacter luteus]
MKKVLLFGASGNLGKEIAKELVQQNYQLTVAVRSEAKAKTLSHITSAAVIVNACNADSFSVLQDSYDVIVSALGKSVSPNDNSKPGFKEVDLDGNSNILHYAVEKGIKKFVYISAFHAEKYPQLEYFRVHHLFAERLKSSGIDYSIIKPPALFSAFIDIIDMAKKGRLVNIGSGDKKTNPVYEGDLAAIVVKAIDQPNTVIEAGGKNIYTRKQLNEIINNEAGKSKKLRTIPLWLLNSMLPLLKLFNKNMYDKFAFFTEVMQHDTIAPQIGATTFEAYVKQKAGN